ncbi:MAG: NFACT family protein [Bacteroidota bacterium]
MVTNYFTLKALAESWSAEMTGCIVGDVYSQSRDELTIALASKSDTWMLRASTHPSLQFIFRSAGYNKARRNVAALFPGVLDKSIQHISLAERDRVLFITFEDNTRLQFTLFGPRANVLHVGPDNVILDAFQRKEQLVGTAAPPTRPAAVVDTLAALKARWHIDKKTTTRAVTSAFPFFNADLAREVVHQAGPLPANPADVDASGLASIFKAASDLAQQLTSPAPIIYWQGKRAVQFALVPLNQQTDTREEPFETVDKAVTIYVRRRLGQRAFDAVYLPLEKALTAARDNHAARLETMLTSLSEGSRADKYERWGHLLMAAQADVPQQTEEVTLPDLFANNEAVTIPLDPALTAVENAQRYYEKARKTRQARVHAEERLAITEQRQMEAASLLEALQTKETRADVEKFEKANKDKLAYFLGHQSSNQPQIPFRRFPLSAGYEVWVGKNAKQNDALTFQYARKFDFWMHARGVPGSHAVLRRPGRTATPGKHILEQAAGIAAYYSKARGSALVPVIITERKYVRKPRGAAAGAVLVEKEQVLLVEPILPD